MRKMAIYTIINKNNFIALLNTIYNNSTSLKYENFGIKYININIHSNIINSNNVSLVPSSTGVSFDNNIKRNLKRIIICIITFEK